MLSSSRRIIGGCVLLLATVLPLGECTLFSLFSFTSSPVVVGIVMSVVRACARVCVNVSEVGVGAEAWIEAGALVPHCPARSVPVTMYESPLAVTVLVRAQQQRRQIPAAPRGGRPQTGRRHC